MEAKPSEIAYRCWSQAFVHCYGSLQKRTIPDQYRIRIFSYWTMLRSKSGMYKKTFFIIYVIVLHLLKEGKKMLGMLHSARENTLRSPMNVVVKEGKKTLKFPLLHLHLLHLWNWKRVKLKQFMNLLFLILLWAFADQQD